MTTAVLRAAGGEPIVRHGACWLGEAAPLDRELLADLDRPVLDVGCGPGRHVAALAEAGVPALGIDVTPAALDRARARGALVLERSVFDRVPGAGRWASAVLLDGNVGIGGDPRALVARVASLLRRRGRMLVETGPPGTGDPRDPGPRRVSLEVAGERGPWFDWVTVGADELGGLAAATGLRLVATRHVTGRWFGLLETL